MLEAMTSEAAPMAPKQKKAPAAAPSAASNKKSANLSGLLSFSVDLQYKDMLLNPSDRSRGQARTEYLKSLLES